jgi:hypothetical protein
MILRPADAALRMTLPDVNVLIYACRRDRLSIGSAVRRIRRKRARTDPKIAAKS